MGMRESREEPLTRAAHMAGIDYHRLRSAAIRQEISARQTATGRWLVNVADALRFKAQTEKAK
jgi:hypothetical protein